MLIDAAISGDRNVIRKEAKDTVKYKDPTTETEHTRNIKTKVIQIIIVATQTTSKSFRKYISHIPREHKIKELQKTAILYTTHIFNKVLM